MRDIGEWRPGFYTEFRCASREHSGLAWGAIFQKMFKFQEMHTFWFWTCLKNQEIVIFPGQKPAGSQDIKELFRIRKWNISFQPAIQGTLFKKLPPQNSFIFVIKSKIDFFPKSWFSIDFYWSKSHFCWKSKWSVWSIGTFSTVRIWKFRMEKGSYGGKVKF